MPTLNTLICGSGGVKNTGFGNCPLVVAFIEGAYAVPEDFIILQEDADDLLAFLTAKLSAPIAERIFPFHDFRVITDGTGDPQFQTFANGSQAFVRDGNNVWTMQYVDGGLCVSNSARSFNGSNYRWLFYDSNGLFFGTKKTDEDGNVGIGGVKQDSFYAYPWKPNDGSNVMSTRMRFDFKPEQVNRDIKYVQSDFDLSSLEGLQNIILVQKGTSVAGVFTIQATAGCEQANMYDLYKTQLTTVGTWVLTNPATGNPITITSVVGNDTAKTLTFTASSADADYPATAGADMVLNTVSASALATAGIDGYEGIPLTVKRG